MTSTSTSTALGRSTTLARSGTRKKKTYDIVQQGIKELYPLGKSDVSPSVDIVFVPGLGANPEDSWKSNKTDFNWTTSPDGLQRDFPRARLLLYMYDSAWSGPLKVKQFMSNIAMGLLIALRSKREDCQRRPIAFIGHSMGGLVIAKAVTLADSRRDLFPIMFEAITACIFFGTPFGGAPVAAAAAMYAQLAERLDAAISSKLLDLMKPGDEELRQLRNDFLRLSIKGSQKIDLFCFWETHPTDFSAIAGLPALFGLTKMAIPKRYAEFVNRDSATISGVEELGLACNHRDLVKFDGPKDDRWTQMVRDPIKRIIHGTQSAVKNRLHSIRDIDQTLIKSIMEGLEGPHPSKKRRLLSQSFAPSSWLPSDPEYMQWLGGSGDGDESMAPSDHEKSLVDFIYVRGREGRGKTNSVMAALNGVENLIRTNEELNTGQDPILLAYFFCDGSTDYSTAEDVLKSVITQLISQQETLAPYAKGFAKKKTTKDDSKSQSKQASITVENLWQSLQDMLADEFIGSRVYLILSNLHALPPESDSTLKLMRFIGAELEDVHSGTSNTRRVLTRWFITSREAHGVDAVLRVHGVRVIDLEDARYENQVQLELRKHAKKMISAIGVEKKYNKALTYFASSLVGKRAQNTQWIDITCVKLGELADTESHLTVRGLLETMPQDLKDLLDHYWLQVFHSNPRDVEKIKEMLRTLVLTYDDPTETELGILAGLASNDQEKAELRHLIEQCKPLLSLKRTSKGDSVIYFTNMVARNHLWENAKALLGLSKEETKWQHGILALRCFSHLKESFDFPPPEPPAQQKSDDDTNGQPDDEEKEDNDNDDDEEAEAEQEEDDNGSNVEGEEEFSEMYYTDSEDEYEEEGDEEEERDPEADILKDKALAYTVKHWLHHASNATPEIAEDLSLEEEFWKPDSIIRHRWLVEYTRLDSTLEGFDRKTLSGLHVAAAIGFRQLVAALIRNGHESEIHQRDSLFNTPLHFAAYLGRPNIVEELLNRGAVIDDAADIGQQTPLAMAAESGHVHVMKKLLLRKADPNAISEDMGPVINSAISSGNRAAVELLVEHDVSLSLPPGIEDDILCPLAMAAKWADYSMFEYLIDKYADRIPPDNYSEALECAASAGRIEVFGRLLAFDHSQDAFQTALDNAVEEWNWEIVKMLLDKRCGLDCNNLFLEAAIGSEPQDKMVELAWQYAEGAITGETLNDALYHATDREKVSTVKLLLQSFCANPNATGEEFGTALTAAAFDGDLEIVELLLDAGANVNDANGWAIQYAAAEGHYDVVQELISRGADVNAITHNDNFRSGTALQGACESGRPNIVSLLLSHEVNPNLGAGQDAPPVVAAAMRGEEEIVAMLVAAKADLDVFGGSDLSTPLINAAAYLPRASLKLLLDAGADINLPNNEGESALIVAARRGEVDAVSFLIDHGADLMHSSKKGTNALQSAFHSQQYQCLGVLVDRVSVLLGAIKSAVDSGNYIVANVVRTAEVSRQTLVYDDESLTVRFQDPASDPNEDARHDAAERPEGRQQQFESIAESAEHQAQAEAANNSETAEQDETPAGDVDDEGHDLPEVHDDSVFSQIMPAENQERQDSASWQAQSFQDLHYAGAPYYPPSDTPPIQRVESPASQAIRRKPAPPAGSSGGGGGGGGNPSTPAAWAPPHPSLQQSSSSSSSPNLVHPSTASFSSVRGSASVSTEASSYTSSFSNINGRGPVATPQYQAYQPMPEGLSVRPLQSNSNAPVLPPPQHVLQQQPQPQPERRYMPYMSQQYQAPAQRNSESLPRPYDRDKYAVATEGQGGGQGPPRVVRQRSSLFGMRNLLDRNR